MDYKEQNKKTVCDFIDQKPNCIFYSFQNGLAQIDSENPQEVLLSMAGVEENIIQFLKTQTLEDIERLKKISKLHSLKKQVEELEKELSN